MVCIPYSSYILHDNSVSICMQFRLQSFNSINENAVKVCMYIDSLIFMSDALFLAHAQI